MNKLEQAARQALIALEDVMADFDGSWALADTAITALREALALYDSEAGIEQAEQSQQADASLEPVAWGCRFQDGSIHDCICPESHAECEGDYNIPLYAAPLAQQDTHATHVVRTKDLTDDELREIMKQPFNQREYLEQFARAVIAADREKNNVK